MKILTLAQLQSRIPHLVGGRLAFAAEPSVAERRFQGLRVMIENPAGSTRSGKSKAGNAWSVKMKHDYGFLARAKGADGEGLDVFLGTDETAPDAYIIHQNNPETGDYDEDKVMLGFKTPASAKAAYLSNYDTPDFFRSMTIIPVEQFKGMLTNGQPGGVHWKRKHGRDHESAAMFDAESSASVPCNMKLNGPALWAELHQWGARGNYEKADCWLAGFAKKLCGDCKQHWLDFVRKNPPPNSSCAGTLFAWTVRAHNAVNQRLSKGALSIDAAQSLWRKRAESTFSSENAGGHWVTMGGDKDAPKGFKGGTPVYIGKGGEIEKGPAALAGRNISNLKEKPGEKKEAAHAPPKDLHARVKELKAQGMATDQAVARAHKEGAKYTPTPLRPTPPPAPPEPVAQPAPAPAANPAASPAPAAAPKAEPVAPKEKKPAKVPPTPKVGPKPMGKKAYSQRDIRKIITERFEQENGAGIPEGAWDVVQGIDKPFEFARGKNDLKGEMNAMTREGGKEGRGMLRSGAISTGEGGGAEDAIGMMKEHYGDRAGEDLYWRMAKARAGGGFEDALDYAENHPDPQMKFMAALHKIKQTEGTSKQEEWKPEEMEVGKEFTIHGVPVKVIDDEDGQKFLVDHGRIPETPVDSLTEIPVDKKSMKDAPLPEIDDDPFGGLSPDEEEKAGAAPETKPEAKEPPAEPAPAPVSLSRQLDLGGNEVGALTGSQNPLFAPAHEPRKAEIPESERVGSKNANYPKHTAEMFPGKDEPVTVQKATPMGRGAAIPPAPAGQYTPEQGKKIKARVKAIMDDKPGTSFKIALAQAKKDLGVA